jgi:predicted outer membrane repeat protein
LTTDSPRASRRLRSIAIVATASLLGGAGALMTATSAAALPEHIVVTSAADDGGGPLITLREAIETANGNLNPADQDLIEIDESLAGQTIEIDSQLFISQSVTIEGLGSDDTRIERSAGNPGSDFFAFAPNNAGATFSLHGITIAGDGTKGGSGLAVTDFVAAAGEIDILDVVFLDLTSATGGAGIVVTGAESNVIVQGSRFEGNETSDRGGAIRIDGANGLALIDSAFTENTADGGGGAIYTEAGSGYLIAQSSRFANNSSGVDGGGAIYVESIPAPSGLIHSDFIENESQGRGGAVYVGSILEGSFGAFQSNFIDNDASASGQSEYGGGAIYAGTVLASFAIDSSTFSGNELDIDVQRYGRSIAIDTLEGFAQILNSTLDELASTEDDFTPEFAIAVGSVSADGLLNVLHSTITAPGALRIGSSAGEANASHTLFDALGEANAIEIVTLPSAAVETDWSLFTTELVPVYVTDDGTNEFEVADLGLNPLADNGGRTETRLPSASSPAREGGNPAFTEGDPAFDQRGEGFARVLTVIDVGAVETEFVLPATGAILNPVLPISAGVLLLLGVGSLVVVWATKRRHG